jgi:O-antigen ligase
MDLAAISSVIRRRHARLAGLILAVAVPVGILAATQGPALLAAIIAAAGALFVLARPDIGLLAAAALIPLENLVVFGGGITGMRAITVLACIGWFGGKLLRRESWIPILSAPVLPTAAAFLAIVLASGLWARHSDATIAGFVQLLQLFVLSLLIVDLAPDWRRQDRLAKVLVLSATVAAILTLSQHTGGVRRAGDDVAGGINNTAALLLTLLPFGFYLIRSQRATRWRLLGLAAVALTVVAVLLTFSRMSLLLLPPLLLTQYWTTLRGRRGRGWLLGLTVAGVVAACFLVPWTQVWERAATIGPYLASTLAATPETITLSSRAYHALVGFAIFLDHPLLGAGYDNYGHLFLTDYQYLLGGAERLFMSVRSAHSSYIGILADLGILGITLWVALQVAAVRAVLRAHRATRGHRESPPHLLVQALLASLLLHVLAFGWYMPNQKEKLLWVLLAMAAVVSRLTATPARQ